MRGVKWVVQFKIFALNILEYCLASQSSWIGSPEDRAPSLVLICDLDDDSVSRTQDGNI
jgi:hypothetical protein